LKRFPALEQLLKLLADLRCPTLVFVDGINADVQRRFASPTLRFETDPLDLAEVGRQCDLGVLNGSFGTTASLVLAGKPLLLVPIYLEQALFSAAVARLGAGLAASAIQPQQIAAGLAALVQSDKHALAAGSFAARYTDHDPQHEIAAMLDRAEELLRGT
jgi:UDP:flavonoid glycosyltransferase YjiC (YdhE family)